MPLTIHFVYACSCSSCGKNNYNIQVPDSIFAKTDEYLISETSANFFKSHIFPDYIESEKKDDKYEVRYNFRIIDYDFVDEEILLITDISGNVLTDDEPCAIPVCLKEPGRCVFISKINAVDLAVREGLPSGVKDWAVEFRWSPVVKRYIWHVIATTAESGNEDNYKAEGEEMMINPVSGEVIKHRAWSIN